jgi:uncharacterized membrane protein required for colicin V production
MTVDIITIFLIGLAAFLGWRKGAVSQIGRIAATVLAVVGASVAAAPVQQVLFAESDWSQPVIEASSLLVAGVLIYLTIAVTGWLVVKAMRAVSENLSRLDRLGGGALGVVKGLLLTYFLLTLFILLEAPAQRLDPSNAMALRGGEATSFVKEHNVLAPWQLPELAELHAALKLRYYAEELDRESVLHEHARANDFLRREIIEMMSHDPVLMQAVIADRFAFTLADPRIRAVLSDEEATAILSSIDWESLLREVQSPVHA